MENMQDYGERMSGSRLMGGKKKQHITAFYMEMLVLVAVFIVVILILTRVFAISRQQSARAQILTNAVCLAENAAEITAASDSEEALLALLGDGGNVSVSEEQGQKIFRARYDSGMNPAAQGNFLVEIEWNPETGDGGSFISSIINVYWNGDTEPVYTLQTGMFRQ